MTWLRQGFEAGGEVDGEHPILLAELTQQRFVAVKSTIPGHDHHGRDAPFPAERDRPAEELPAIFRRHSNQAAIHFDPGCWLGGAAHHQHPAVEVAALRQGLGSLRRPALPPLEDLPIRQPRTIRLGTGVPHGPVAHLEEVVVAEIEEHHIRIQRKSPVLQIRDALKERVSRNAGVDHSNALPRRSTPAELLLQDC